MLDPKGNCRGRSQVLPEVEWRCYSDLGSCAGPWRLLESHSDCRVFQTFAWIDGWFRRLGAQSGIEPRVVVGWRNDRPCLLVPLGLTRRFGARTLVWLAGEWSDYNAPVAARDLVLPVADAAIARLWEEIAQAAGPASLLELVKQPPELAGRIVNCLRHPDHIEEDNGAYILDLQPDVPALLATLYGPTTSSGLNRKQRKLQREGAVAFEIMTGDRAAKAVGQMLAWKREALDRRGASNPFAFRGSVDFLMDLARDNPETAEVHAITVDGAPVAAALCLQEGDNLILYQTAFDDRLRNCSPGALLIRRMIETAAQRGCRSLDFSFGDDSYKTELCSRRISLGRTILPLGVLGRTPALMAQAHLRTRRWAKTNATAHGIVLAVNRNIRMLQARKASQSLMEASLTANGDAPPENLRVNS